MEVALSKNQPQSGTQDETSSKGLELEETNANLSTNDSEVCDSESVDSDNDSWSTMDSTDPWNTSLDSETEHLSFMPVDPHGRDHLEKLNAFSQHRKLPQLKTIDIDFTHSIEDGDNQQNEEMAKILNGILKASAGSLEEITLRTPIGYLPGLVFPVMKRVAELNLLFFWYGSDATSFTGYLRAGEIFPKGFKFSVLPNLRRVAIDLETEGKSPQYYSRFDCWKINLKSCGIAKRVKSIQYNDDCGFSKQRLRTTFRNARWTKTSDLNITYTSSEEEDSEETSSEEDSEDEPEYC